MMSVSPVCKRALVVLTALAGALSVPAAHAEEFPFGLEMTLDASRMPGNKRVPSLDIGDNGDVVLELWCKGGKGQFSVAGNTISGGTLTAGTFTMAPDSLIVYSENLFDDDKIDSLGWKSAVTPYVSFSMRCCWLRLRCTSACMRCDEADCGLPFTSLCLAA